MRRSGPRSAFLVSTWSSVHGFRLAVAAEKRGRPDPATWWVSYSFFDSSSASALVHPKRNCSYVSAPRVPAARQQPQSVDENDRLLARRVGAGDIGFFVLGQRGHGRPPERDATIFSANGRVKAGLSVPREACAQRGRSAGVRPP